VAATTGTFFVLDQSQAGKSSGGRQRSCSNLAVGFLAHIAFPDSWSFGQLQPSGFPGLVFEPRGEWEEERSGGITICILCQFFCS
jgi:hypothetical protein